MSSASGYERQAFLHFDIDSSAVLPAPDREVLRGWTDAPGSGTIDELMRPPEAVLTNPSLLVIKPVLQCRQQAVPVTRRQRVLLSPSFRFLQILPRQASSAS